MKQRAGLARALANNPRVLLMDEPFGAIDVQTRNVLQDEMIRIQKETRKTILFVTHSVEEAIYLGDRIAIFSARPGTVKDLVVVRNWLSSRRNKLSEDFLELKKHIMHILTKEVSKTIFREALRGC
jgi:NitT/TauT family transport system ATP-binding protein